MGEDPAPQSTSWQMATDGAIGGMSADGLHDSYIVIVPTHDALSLHVAFRALTNGNLSKAIASSQSSLFASLGPSC